MRLRNHLDPARPGDIVQIGAWEQRHKAAVIAGTREPRWVRIGVVRSWPAFPRGGDVWHENLVSFDVDPGYQAAAEGRKDRDMFIHWFIKGNAPEPDVIEMNELFRVIAVSKVCSRCRGRKFTPGMAEEEGAECSFCGGTGESERPYWLISDLGPYFEEHYRQHDPLIP